MTKPDPPIQESRPRVLGTKIQNPMATMADLQRAVAELGIDVPILDARLLNGRLELRLYGGRVVVWPPIPENRNLVFDENQVSSPPAKPATKPARKDTDHE